jgi:hypothetical protein
MVNYITAACGEVKYFHSPTIPLFITVTFRTHIITQTFVESWLDVSEILKGLLVALSRRVC